MKTDKSAKYGHAYDNAMGYYRPITEWNIGKKQEHKERVYFAEGKSVKPS